MNKRRILSAVLLIVVLLIIGCTKEKEVTTIRIAEQYGLAYAPLTLIKELEIDKKYMDEIQIEWHKLGNTAAIREAMVSGNLDIGFMGIPPFLIGYDKGMDWKIFTGLTESPLGLVTHDLEKESIHDITTKDRIVLPQPGSIQHILLTMAAEKEFADSKKFDKQLVTMKHPDGMQALLAKKDITMHFTSPPYLFKEIEEGNKLILNGKEAFGGNFTFIVGTATDEVLKNKKAMSRFTEMINESIEYIKNNPESAAKILSGIYGIEESELLGYLSNPELKYGDGVLGIETFSSFMYKEGYLEKEILIEEVIWSLD